MYVSSISNFNNNSQFKGINANTLKKRALPLVASTALLANIGLASCSKDAETPADKYNQYFQEQYEKAHPVMSKAYNKDGNLIWWGVGALLLGAFLYGASKNEDKNK